MSTFYLDYENGNNANSGADWANAWKDLTNGATAARIAPGDTIRIAKSPDPVSLGITATWTDLSRAVTLASALTQTVDQCESGWTAANSSTVTHTTTRKEGSNSVTVTKATYATSTLYAYKALAGATDFSAWDALTFWFRNDAAIADASRWYLALCSDAAGATPVDVFPIPAIPSTNRWLPLCIAKSGGGNLGASIQSIALYTGTSAPTGGQDCILDNIEACTFGGFSLQSLISKSSSATSTTEGWYPIKSIVGTAVQIDNDTNSGAGSGQGYSGTTETVTTYRRETIKTALAASITTQVQAVQDSGTSAGGRITYSGGWNTSSGLQDGETFFDGLNGNGYGIYLSGRDFVATERLSSVRYYAALSVSGGGGCTIEIGSAIGCQNAGLEVSGNASGSRFDVSFTGHHGSAGIALGTGSEGNAFAAQRIAGNQSGILAYASCTIENTSIGNNSTRSINALYGGRVTLIDCTLSDSTETAHTTYADGRVISLNHNGSGYSKHYTDGGTCTQQATTFAAPATGAEWSLLTSATTRNSAYPLWLVVAKRAFVADEEVTIKAVLKKAHATNVDGRLVVRGGQIAGVDSDVTATLANNTDEQELTLNFTPTEDGVVEIEVWAEYVAGHAAVSIDRFTEISQAA